MINTNSTKSHHWLWLILAATVALTAWTAMNSKSDDADDAIELAQPSTISTKNIQANTESTKSDTNNTTDIAENLIDWDRLKRDEMNVSGTKDIFKPHSWVIIPPAPKLKQAPPPKPVAPPSPFTYFGKMEDGPKGTLLFLIANNKVYSVKKGSKIDPFWRYDSEDANNIYMTYLPLNLPQVLSKNQKSSAQIQANVPAEINYEGN